MSPGNCSGSYSAPPRTRAIAWRSSSSPREVDATTFSILKLDEETPSAPEAWYKRAGSDQTQVVPYILRSRRTACFRGLPTPPQRSNSPLCDPFVGTQTRCECAAGKEFSVAARDRFYVASIVT